MENTDIGKLARSTFKRSEIEFLRDNEACRVATCHDNIPHVVPVSYILFKDEVYFATDYDTLKFRNIRHNRKIALVVDEYTPKENKAVCIQGLAEVIERGTRFRSLYTIFHRKFIWVRSDPWKEAEAPFIRIVSRNITSWGLE